MAKANVSVRLDEEIKDQLLSLAAQEGKQCSDLLKEFIEAGLSSPGTNLLPEAPVTETTIARPAAAFERSVAARKANVAGLLDETLKMEEWRGKLRRLVEENGGNGGVFSKGAPDYLKQALRLCEARATELSEKMKSFSDEIDGDVSSTGAGVNQPISQVIKCKHCGLEDEYDIASSAKSLKTAEPARAIESKPQTTSKKKYDCY